MDALRGALRWHDYREWKDLGPDAYWPGTRDPMKRPPFPGACGDCGRHKAEHPIPSLPGGAELTARLFLALAAAGSSPGFRPEVPRFDSAGGHR